jgi:hypothetical protein
MPETQITSKAPFSADILVRQESHTVTPLRDNGYNGTPIQVDGGILLNLKVTANTLSDLQTKIEAHVALIE